MPIFGHSEFLPVFLYQKGFNKFGMHIFGHSELYQFSLGKIVRKNLEQPVLAIPNYTSLLGKIVRKNLELPFLAIPNLYQSFGEKLSEKNWNSHFWPF